MSVSLDEQAAATHARLLARQRGEEPPAEAYVQTPAELERSAEIAKDVEPPYKAIVIDRTSGLVRGIIPNAQTWRLRLDATARAPRSGCGPRRVPTTRRRRPGGSRAHVVASRDGPARLDDDPPERPLRVVPLAAFRDDVDRWLGGTA